LSCGKAESLAYVPLLLIRCCKPYESSSYTKAEISLIFGKNYGISTLENHYTGFSRALQDDMDKNKSY
ncbi:hypothetical protein, partial [Butyricicoccus sp.]|uniref:hypothetical protein n=1 Tax=Butyricicoccus sp. TaxID=2049021 RepID=UPI003D7E2A92